MKDTKDLKVGDKISFLFGNTHKEGTVIERNETTVGIHETLIIDYVIQVGEKEFVRRPHNRLILF